MPKENEPSPGAIKAVSILFGITPDSAQMDKPIVDTQWGRKSVLGLAAIIDECTGARDLLSAMESIIDNGDMIVDNPDEGPNCYLCGAPWSLASGVTHEKDCPIHAARAAISKVRENTNY